VWSVGDIAGEPRLNPVPGPLEWEAAIRLREPEVKAFAWFELDRVRRRTASAGLGRLRGAWVGVKDIFDTAGIPTERGSALFSGRIPTTTAAAVRRIEAAGGVVAGKTVTAELASAEPGPTTNPWNPLRTPGGSSMGSAAGVAAGMLPLAIGTQTAGSVIRPAAYCGVVGFKPSAGTIPMDGVMILSDTLDQPGTFATTVAAAALLASVMASADLGPEPPRDSPRYGLYRSPEWHQLEPAARDSLARAVALLRAAGATVDEAVPPAGFDAALAVHRRIMVVEKAANLGPDVARAPDLVSASFRRGLAEGEATSAADYKAALTERERLVAAVARWAGPYDAILCPPATGEAPDLSTTGDPRPCTRWSLVGAPAITIPAGRGPTGLPIGLQLCGAPGSDGVLCGAAEWAEAALADALATAFPDGNEVEVIGPA
jgi:Asp-tRNA(Asn)/Glu-tRNA(Gln) amidotransferase A subunit family amidase